MGDPRAIPGPVRAAGRAVPAPVALDAVPYADDRLLLSRQAGERLRDALLGALRSLPEGGVLIADLRGIREVSSAAWSALFAAVAAVRTAAYDNRYLLFWLDGGPADAAAGLALVARDAHDAVPVVDSGGRVHVVGRLPKAERDTLELIAEQGEMTAAMLRAALPLMASAASNRLRWLYMKRLVRREERAIAGTGGREFAYRPILA